MTIFIKKLSITASLLGLAAILPTAHAADFEDYARVTNVTPQLEQVNVPRQECRNEYETGQRHYQQHPSERSAGGSIIGGIAGGLLGAQVGGGNGRIAAAAAGALTGAIVGDRIENNGNNNSQPVYESHPVRQCRNIDNWETRTNGYAVTYEYHNRTYTTVMPYDPGSRLRLHVSLTPRP
ncbi:MAG: glycine zipper 2TM domain-containing protein [Burkholderiales bacterium]|nr:glycine zipper 2TM domain-containing protein [Burkholderiales bacterium]